MSDVQNPERDDALHDEALGHQTQAAQSPVDAAVSDDAGIYGEPGTDWATSLSALDAAAAAALLRMTRAMYPHDHLPDVHYARVVEELDKKAAADAEMSTLLHDGVARLDTVAGASWLDVDDERRTEVLHTISDQPFFAAVATETVTGLYSQHDIWPFFGYEGASNDKGGYVDRGFDDIDWLDDAPDLRSKDA